LREPALAAFAAGDAQAAHAITRPVLKAAQMG